MAQFFDVFNGDADGLCAWLQWRLAHPAQSHIVTGVKRDIALLDHVDAQAGDQVCVFDLSLDKNRAALLSLLDRQVAVFYVDHHFAGELPQANHFTGLIDTRSQVCSALLVNQHLQNRFVEWALVGAFGDNLQDSAYALADELGLPRQPLSALQQLGICLNYNSYGETLADLLYSPQQLAQWLLNYTSPFEFIEDRSELVANLNQGYYDDMQQASVMQAELANETIALFILPDAAWARRVNGVWSNQLANQYPDRAHAVFSIKPAGGYQVSVRAPLVRKYGADELCRQFASGGGRQSAAGVNHLPEADFERFVQAFTKQYS